MKIKSKVIGPIFMIMVCTLFIYLIYLNIKVDRYKSPKAEEKHIEIVDAVKKVENIEEKVDIVEDVKEEVEEDPIVYDGKTLEQLAEQLNKSLNSTIAGKGYLIASYSLERGVDPYLATAIILQETGCKWSCSSLVYECNNVGGQVGSGCGGYSYFPTIDDGIKSFIDNLYYNYISQGLTTPELMNSKYAVSTVWADYVNNYIESIKAQ